MYNVSFLETNTTSLSPSEAAVAPSTSKGEKINTQPTPSLENRENGSKIDSCKQDLTSCSNGTESSVRVIQPISKTASTEQSHAPDQSHELSTSKKKNLGAVEELITLHSHQIGLVVHDATSLAKVQYCLTLSVPVSFNTQLLLT